MHAVEDDADWHLIARTTGEPVGEPIKARELMREIAEAAWRCADPGVQYDTTINQWHTSPNSGRINASNPCSEYMHVDDSACNLASLNLMKFRRPDGSFDVETFQHTVDIILLAQEIVVSPSSYPTEEIGENARAFRQLGLGYANLGAYLMANGFAYDSDEGRGAAAAITALMTGRAYAQSAQDRRGDRPVRPLRGEPRGAQQRHAHAPRRVLRRAGRASVTDKALLAAARETWNEAVALGELYGYRNAQASVLAPTGTISFLMDCDTTGIEPDFSLVKYKELVGGGNMIIANRTVPMALRTLGYDEAQVEQIEAYVAEHGTIVGAPGLAAEHLSVFDVAVGERAISHAGHIKMMGAVQPFLSGAISKTVNMPQTATVEDIAEAYIQAWRLGVKALAIYRDGSKTAQALRTDAQEVKEIKAKAEAALSAGEEIFTQSEVDELITVAVEKAVAKVKAREDEPLRRRMPRERKSLTHKFSLGGHEGYITAGMYDGRHGRGDLPDRHRQGGLDPPRHDELVRHGDLHLAAVRRAAGDAGAQVRLHALRAGRDHHQPGDPVRQVDARLHHALARVALPGRGHPGGARHPHPGGPRPQDRRGRRRPARPAAPPARPTATAATAAPRRLRPGPRAQAPTAAMTDTPAGRPGPPGRPGPRPGLQPVRRHDAAHRLVLHVLELRQQHRLRLILTLTSDRLRRRRAARTTAALRRCGYVRRMKRPVSMLAALAGLAVVASSADAAAPKCTRGGAKVLALSGNTSVVSITSAKREERPTAAGYRPASGSSSSRTSTPTKRPNGRSSAAATSASCGPSWGAWAEAGPPPRAGTRASAPSFTTPRRATASWRIPTTRNPAPPEGRGTPCSSAAGGSPTPAPAT